MEAKTNNEPQPEPQNNDPQTPPKIDLQNEPPKVPADTLQSVLSRARQGDKTVLPKLQRLLDMRPGIWRVCHDLVAMSEEAWLKRMSEGDLLLSESLRRQVQQLKLDLVGPTPTPLEKLLADRIVAAWLAVHDAEICEASGEPTGGKLAAMRLKRLESANKRFHAAVKSLSVARRLVNGLKIEITHTDGQSVANKGSGMNAPSDPGQAARPPDVHDRLKNLFDAGAKMVESAAAGVGV